ncbi:MAG: hypothetical protein D4R70_05370 [Betaproteobacteria bacterium]|nr:MAG: hypothetical protein D4R70_05370 [Betaproteobacteria bacterium]
MSASRHTNPTPSSHASARIAPVIIEQTSPRRAEAEAFIRAIFDAHYDARISTFAPTIMGLEHDGTLISAAGWRGAAHTPLFLENYLDQDAEVLISRLAGHPVARSQIVEVGHLASCQAGSGVRMILSLAAHLDQLGYEWVMFTATRELIGIFTKLGLPPLALAIADPARLGQAAHEWGHYYDTSPIVVAGRIHLARARRTQR